MLFSLGKKRLNNMSSMKQVFTVTGMTCKSCEETVSSSLETIAGVVSANASRESSLVEIDLKEDVPIETLKEAASVGGKYKVSEEEDEQVSADRGEKQESLYPLFLIISFIFGACVLISINQGEFAVQSFMRHFMAGFFLVFSFFKLLDISGFVDAYRGYDLLAQRSETWAYLYPFAELALGILYALNLFPIAVNSAALILMSIGAVGVLKALTDKQAISCACLGTALNLPMTKVTLIEDLAMAVMAFVMLMYNI